MKPRLLRQVFDAEAEVEFYRRPYRGKSSKATLKVRIVGLRNDAEGTHHWYITNLPPEEVSAEEIAKLYQARWTIELLFRELKSCYRLDQLPSRKATVIEALVYASILTLLASRALLAGVREWGGLTDRTTPLERWARLVLSAAHELLTIVLDSPEMAASREEKLLPFFLHHAPDPNRNRVPLLEQAGLAEAA